MINDINYLFDYMIKRAIFPDENSFCLEKMGCRPLEYLEQVGWLNNRTWLAHGIHFNDEEIQKLGASKTGIAHCPSSNMLLSSGVCRVQQLEKSGAPVGIGVDGSASLTLKP